MYIFVIQVPGNMHEGSKISVVCVKVSGFTCSFLLVESHVFPEVSMHVYWTCLYLVSYKRSGALI